MKLVTELWIRYEGGHQFEGQGLCWKYLEGTSKIDESVTAIDVVNVRSRNHYIVASVHEHDTEMPAVISGRSPPLSAGTRANGPVLWMSQGLERTLVAKTNVDR